MNTCICTTRKQWGTRLRHRTCAGLLAALAAVFTANIAQAQQPSEPAPQQYNINADTLGEALNELATQSKLQITYPPELVRNKTAPAINGEFTWRAALDEILADSGLEWGLVNGTTVVIKKAAAPGASPPSEEEEEIEEAYEEALELEEIIVVGSRLGALSPVESALPIKVIGRDEIDRSGASNIAQVMSYLSEVSVNNLGDTNIGTTSGGFGGGGNEINASTVQLRGLPVGTTLVLINGRRSGESSALMTSGQFDLNTIPLALVERIEVLPAGASAVYGGDGLAGVVNIVLRRDASGFEMRGRHAAAEGYDESQASVMWGKSWSRGQLTVTANWQKSGRLSSFERSLTADQDYTRFGGQDLRSSTIGFPANVYSLDGCEADIASIGLCLVPPEERGNLPGLDSPFATVPVGQDGQDLTPADFVGTAGNLNRVSAEFNFYSPAEVYGLNVNGSVNATSDIELFTELTYSRRDIPAREASFGFSSGHLGVESAVVSADNPFNPFGVDVGVSVRFQDTGIMQEFGQSHWRALFGARGRLSRWDWELTAAQSRDRSEFIRRSPVFDGDAVIAALQSTDPATALNPFAGDGSLPWTEELLTSLLLPANEADLASELRDITGFVRGPLIKLPAGDVLGLVGGEYQKQTLENSLSGAAALSDDGDTSRAVFGELRVPLWAGKRQDSRERLALTGALRRESSGRFESAATTETIGMEFRPWRPLLFRATYSTAFKPLPVFSIRESTMFDTFVSDPQFGGQQFPVQAILGGGVPPGLKPETSKNRTLGLVYSPTADWRMTLTYWSNRLDNRFTSPGLVFLVENEANFPERINRDPDTGFITSIDIRPINVTLTNVEGIDLAVDGRWSTRHGDFVPSLAATYTLKHEEQVLPNLPVQDHLAIRRNTGWSPRWKIVPRLGWDYLDRFYATLSGRYVSAYEDPTPLFTGPDTGTQLTLGDIWLVDLNVDLNIGGWLAADSKMLSGTRLNLGANNLFDQGLDFCNSCGSTGYDASQYDILGRTLYAELKLSL